METTEQELFDALTAYYKNDWRKTGQSRRDGIQVENSKWHLIYAWMGHRSHNVFVYKHDENYDLSKLAWDIHTRRGRNTEFTVHWGFHIGDINTVAKRKEFLARRLGWMNRYEVSEVA